MLNVTLKENLPQSKFVTLFLGRLDTKTGVIEYANAGHTPPLWIARRSPDTWFVPTQRISPKLASSPPRAASTTRRARSPDARRSRQCLRIRTLGIFDVAPSFARPFA